MGQEQIDEFPCDAATNTCRVTVPAPGAALIFFSEPAVRESQVSASMTFATTAVTKLQNTATVAQEVLETSNGHSGRDRVNALGEDVWGSTSRGSVSAAVGQWEGGVLGVMRRLFGGNGKEVLMGSGLLVGIMTWGAFTVMW